MNQKEIKSPETENRGDTLKVMGLRPWTHDNNPATIEETLCKRKNRARLLSPIAPITGAVAGDDDDELEHSEERTRNTVEHTYFGAASERRFLTLLLNIYERLQWLEATTLLPSRSTTAAQSHG